VLKPPSTAGVSGAGVGAAAGAGPTVVGAPHHLSYRVRLGATGQQHLQRTLDNLYDKLNSDKNDRTK